MKEEKKAWLCAFIVSICWSNAFALSYTAAQHWREWDASTAYGIALFTAFSVIMGVAAGVAAFLYSE